MARATDVFYFVALLNLAILKVSGVYVCPSTTTILYDMEPCMPSVEGAYPDPPNEDCCFVVRTTEPSCLCSAFSGYKNSPSINERAALTLPRLCGKVVPFNFTCNGDPVPSGVELPRTRKLKLL
ncbi:hypothetical protein KC19_VG308400 [Ceratodon purpureus]|uniref:Bifunctional inhibitor/plant lipid transfer protein/seed storage helical domain-containing protein n=1 Tax=Ceratodon purpureus TaxID=3225 RepID=A0A8T0HVW9_CERPU|nr:hypothetical protein KC19_VG308400 [Ceratodon purpureus]